MTKKYVEVIKALAPLNPNKFTVIEAMALDRVEDKIHQAISYIEFGLSRDPEKNSDRIQAGIKYYRLLLNCCEMFSSSHLLRPVNGLVISRDRKRIAKILSAAEKLVKEHDLYEASKK